MKKYKCFMCSCTLDQLHWVIHFEHMKPKHLEIHVCSRCATKIVRFITKF